MDTEKLLRVLKDALDDEVQLELGGKIDAYRDAISQNSEEGFAKAQETFNTITGELKSVSDSYKFSRTEAALMERVGGGPYFGKRLVLQLSAINNLRGYQILQRLDKFRTSRNSFIARARQLVDALENLHVEEYRPDQFEIGLVLPESQGDADKLLKRVGEFQFLVEALSEAATGEYQPVEVTRLSTGSLEIFSLQSAEVAAMFSTLFVNISQIWDRVAKQRSKADEIVKDADLSEESKRRIQEVFAEESERLKAAILDELPEKVLERASKKLEEGRRNEIRNQIRVGVRAAFGWLELGVEVDVIPIRLQDASTQPTKKQQEDLVLVQDMNDKLEKVYRLPEEQRKLPFKLELPKEATTVKRKPATKKSQAKRSKTDAEGTVEPSDGAK